MWQWQSCSMLSKDNQWEVCKGIQVSVVGSNIGRQQKGMVGDYVGTSVSMRKSSWNAVYRHFYNPWHTWYLVCCIILWQCFGHWDLVPPECQSCSCVCFGHARTGPLQSPLRKFYLHPLEQSRIYILVRLLSGVSLEGQAWINYLNEKHRTNGFTEVFSTGIKCITITRKIFFLNKER